MAGNPILGFLEARPTGTDPHSTVTKMLRFLGIAVLAGFVVTVVNGVLGIALGATYNDAPGAAINAVSAIISIVIGGVIAALVCWWITFTVTAWANNDPRGSTHALIIGILATVFGGLGVLGGLLGGFIVGAAVFGAGLSPIYMVVNGIGLLIAAFECFCGIMILVNRGKVTQGTTTRVGAAGN